MPNPREHLLKEAGRHHVQVDGGERPPSHGRSGQVIRGLTAPVVHHDRLSQQAGDLHGGPRRQQERGVRGREHVDDVCVSKAGRE